MGSAIVPKERKGGAVGRGEQYAVHEAVHVYACMCMCAYLLMYACMYVCMHVRRCVCMHACVCKHVYLHVEQQLAVT